MSTKSNSIGPVLCGLLLLSPALGANALAYDRAEVLSRFCRGEDFFIVTTTEDHEDSEGCSDKDCTLREAVNAANLCPPDQPGEIKLSPGTYRLETAGFAYPTTDSSVSAAGPAALPIHGDVVIYGNGAIIQRGEKSTEFRLFLVNAGSALIIRDATLQSGSTRRSGRGTGPRDYGGAIFVQQFGILSLHQVTVRGNYARHSGGGIWNEGASVLSSSTLSDNWAAQGGAVFNDSGANLHVTRSTFSANEVGGLAGHGGGLYNRGTAEIEASTISGNRGSHDGIGINHRGGSLSLRDVTIYGNESDDPSGQGVFFAAPVQVTNSIVARNTPVDCSGDLISASFTSGGVNLDSDGTCEALGPSANFGVTADPLLGPLQANGGSTLTHHMSATSPALDSGESCSLQDQRGESRPRDGDSNGTASCDIGAVEYLFDVSERVESVFRKRFLRSIGMSRFHPIPLPIFDE